MSENEEDISLGIGSYLNPSESSLTHALEPLEIDNTASGSVESSYTEYDDYNISIFGNFTQAHKADYISKTGETGKVYKYQY
jgi:hypothetical protein